jgi:hypothetical protein
MQIKLRRTSSARPSDRSSAGTQLIANIFQGTNVVRRRRDNPFKAPRTIRQSPTLTASGPFRSSPEIQPAINTHRSRSGQRFVQSIFSSPPRRPPLECFPSVSRRGADLKILCSIPLTEYRLDLPSTLNIVPLAVAAFGKVAARLGPWRCNHSAACRH